MIERITNVMVDSGSAWVLWALFALSFLCVVVSLERFINFQRTRADLVRRRQTAYSFTKNSSSRVGPFAVRRPS